MPLKRALNMYLARFRLTSGENVLRSSKRYDKDKETIMSRIVFAQTQGDAEARAKAHAAAQWGVVSVEEVRDAEQRKRLLARLQVIE